MIKTVFDKALDSAQLNLRSLVKSLNSLPEEERNKLSASLEGLDHALTELSQEKQYLHMFANKHTVMLLINPESGEILEANPAAEEFYGYSRSQLLSIKITDINILSRSDVKEEMDRARREERNYFNFKHRLASGDIRDVEVYSDPVKIDDNDYLFSVIHDITLRKQAEAELENERRLLRTLIDNIPDQIFARDRDCRFILNNLADARIMGVTEPASLLGKNDFDFYLPELASKYQSDDKFVMETDQPLNVPEELCITADGEQIWVNTIKVPLHDGEGNVIGLVGIAHDITARKEMELTLRESEEKFRALFEDAIEGIAQTTPDGKIIQANHSYARMAGYDSVEDMINTLPDVSKLYAHHEDRVRLVHALEENSRLENYEAEFALENGRRIWCSMNINAVRGEDGKLIRLDSRLMDITERKLAEIALLEKTEELDRFFNLSLDLLCIADTNGIFRRLNLAWEDLLGYSLDDLTGNSFLDLVHPDDLDKTRTAITELSSQKPVINFVNRYRCKDGSYRWIEWRSVPVGDLIYAAARDITEHKQAEEKLYESQRMLQLVLDNIPQRVFWKDNNLNFMGCNRWLAMDAGIAKTTDIIGKSDFDLNWKEFADQYRSDDRSVMVNNTPRLDFEELQQKPDGSITWLRTNKIPLHDRGGKVIGILGTYEDITNRKQAEEQVRLTNEKLTGLVNTLERRNREANLLREMDDLLQVCNSSDEAYSVTRKFGSRLFPDTSGALFLVDNSRRLVEAVAVWGENLQSELIFSPEDCWTLRRGQSSQWNSSTDLRCKHIPGSFAGEYIGYPMLAAGELMGLLHIESETPGWRTKEVGALAHILAEHLALSLSNIALREKLHAQSIRDPLTGLFNRRYMEETMEREIVRANRAQKSIGIIMLDIDHFKNFNDDYGHEAGDAILQNMGRILQKQVRGSDIACRFGGEEFILILPDASLETARERAEKIRLAVKELQIESAGKMVGNITVSLGAAVYPDHGHTPVELLQRVDKALYVAKHNGRDRVETAG